MNYCIDVEFLVGTTFNQACEEAKHLCVKMDAAYVKFDFNGVKVSVGQKYNVDSDPFPKLHEQICNGKEHKYLVLNE